jgi:hypothetical protein
MELSGRLQAPAALYPGNNPPVHTENSLALAGKIFKRILKKQDRKEEEATSQNT